MKPTTQMRTLISFLITVCLLMAPISAFARKGDEHYKRGLKYEAAQQWDKAAQEFTLAVAADPSNIDYQLHFRRACFNASQLYMQQGRALSEQRDFVGAYNAFRLAYGYDPVNQLATSEMERMLRLQAVKEGTNGTGGAAGTRPGEDSGEGAPANSQLAPEPLVQARPDQMRIISYSGDLKAFIRSLAEQLNLNVIFDRTSFAQPRTIDINLKEVTTAQALDYIFLQEGLFFQKLSRRTVLVADQTRRPQYQQLVLRTFFLSNVDPNDAMQLVQRAIPPSVGRPQTIVVPDKITNSLTVRDTAENVRLIGELLQSIDKDRAEVVMDVNIYEVSQNDLLQLGNQLGTDSTLANLGGVQSGYSILQGSVARIFQGATTATTPVPMAFGSALVFPSSALAALQSRNRTKLIASTEVHAFSGEESTARIGQRVPVQTAQAYPFGIQTGQPAAGSGSVFPTGGFPVINYEPTGLTLKFTPQVFSNLDVQVKMSIEAKDVLDAGTLTPTFTERTITGTARVQNNRTMLLASVAQTVQSNGRKGLAVLGLIPVLGRLFTAPTHQNRQTDVVIAVTPRVLRAPAVTPRDEEMRPSGTLSAPTTGSLEAMIRETDREDQIAAARHLPRNAQVQLPDVEPAPFAPGARSASSNTVIASTGAQSTANSLPGDRANVPLNVTSKDQTSAAAVASSFVPVQAAPAQKSKTEAGAEELPAFVPAPKSLVSGRTAATVAAVNPGVGSPTGALLTSLPSPIDVSVNEARARSRIAQLRLASSGDSLRTGEKRRLAVELKSDVPLGLAVLTLRFDPKVVRVLGITPGTLFSSSKDSLPSITQSVDPGGMCLVSISALSGATPMRGAGVLIFVEVEAVGAGDTGLAFDGQKIHLVATDASDVLLDLLQGRVTVTP